MKKINKNKTVKTLQITGVEYVTPICKWNYLAEIAIVVNKNWSKDAINTEGKTLYSAFRFLQIFNLGNGSILVEDKANNKYDIININE